eukprot:TRINITY_DN12416_c4_g7_i3.p2 TRINITY_DN12416_c4_g7~~TRINITY_DN12416_c4_g7_i3.p2  ORF type:complete len:136 (+),score=21.37 TRINITY_DN12416_c4_g7_i3:1159-1566(+)
MRLSTVVQVCMSESMDTMVLPCRHLCLCNGCADVLRYQASKCPICRAPFHSLLQIQVAKREEDLSEEVLEATQEQEDTPRGYRMVPVVDALKAKGGSTGGGYIDVADGMKGPCVCVCVSRESVDRVVIGLIVLRY